MAIHKTYRTQFKIAISIKSPIPEWKEIIRFGRVSMQSLAIIIVRHQA